MIGCTAGCCWCCRRCYCALSHSFQTDRYALRSMHSITFSRAHSPTSQTSWATPQTAVLFAFVFLSHSVLAGQSKPAHRVCVCVRASVCVTYEIKFICVYKKSVIWILLLSEGNDIKQKGKTLQESASASKRARERRVGIVVTAPPPTSLDTTATTTTKQCRLRPCWMRSCVRACVSASVWDYSNKYVAPLSAPCATRRVLINCVVAFTKANKSVQNKQLYNRNSNNNNNSDQSNVCLIVFISVSVSVCGVSLSVEI